MEAKENLGTKTARLLYPIYIGQILSILITATTFIVLTRLLLPRPSTYGLYVFAFGFSGLIDAVGNFGIGSFLANNIAKAIYKKDVKSLSQSINSGYALLIPIGIGLSLIGIVLSPYLSSVVFKSVGVSALSLILASLTILFSMTFSTSNLALIGFSKGKSSAFSNVFVDIIQLSSILTFIYLGYGVNGAISGMLLGYIIGLTVSMYLVYRAASEYKGLKLGLPSKEEFLSTLKFTTPLAANNVLNTLTSNFAIIFLGFFVSTAILGQFGAALTGITFASAVPSAISSVLISMFSTSKVSGEKHSEKTYNKMIIYAMIFSIPLIIYIGVMAKPGAFLLISNNYTYAPLYLELMAFGTVISILGLYIASMIISTGQTQKILKYNLLSVIIQFAAMIIITPYLTSLPEYLVAMGAIVSLFFIGNLIQTLLYMRISTKLLNVKFDYKRILRLFISNAVLAVLLWPSLKLQGTAAEIVSSIIILIITYPILIVVFNVVKKEDVMSINKYASNLPVLDGIINFFANYANYLIKVKSVVNGNQ